MKNGTKTKVAPSIVKEGLSRDVHIILSACLHQFDERQELEEKCINVDAILSGNSTGVRQLHERRTGRTVAPRAFEGSLSRGKFIPHENLFSSIVKAHA